MDKVDGIVNRGKSKRHGIESNEDADLGALAPKLRGIARARIEIDHERP